MCTVAFATPLDADGESDAGVPVDISGQLSQFGCSVSMKDANTDVGVNNWIKNVWLKNVDWTKITGVTPVLSEDYEKNLTSTVKDFKAAKAGTASNKDGDKGSFTLTIDDSEKNISAIDVAFTITPVFDYTSIKCEVSMEDCNTETDVLKWLGSTWVNSFKTAIGETTGTFTFEKSKDTVFKAAVGGTADKKTGTAGTFTFDVKKTDEGTPTIVAENLVCTITAFDYGQIVSDDDRTVIYEGEKLSGLDVDVKDHVITEEDLEKLVKALKGKDGSLVESFTGEYTEYTRPLVFGEGDKTWSYENGDVVKYNGKTYVILIEDIEFSLFSVDGNEWVKFDRATNDLILDIEGSQYECSSENKIINVNGVPYLVGYSEYDTHTPPLQDREYIIFLYDLDGKSAGYMVLKKSNAIRGGDSTTFVFNKGMGPDDREDAKPVMATYISDKGEMTLLYNLASKDVTVKNKDTAVTGGNILISLGKTDVENAGFYSIGEDGCVKQTINAKEGGDCTAVCPVTAGTTLVAVLSEACSADIPTADLVFEEKSGGSGKSNTTLYIAVAAVIVLLIGGGFYYVRFMKP